MPSRHVLLEAFRSSYACNRRNRARVHVRGIGGGVHAEVPPDEEGEHLEGFCYQANVRRGRRRLTTQHRVPRSLLPESPSQLCFKLVLATIFFVVRIRSLAELGT